VFASSGAGRLPFPLPGSPRRFARDRTVDLRHVVLDLEVDFGSRSVAGTVTHQLTPLRPDVTRVQLDAVELAVFRVTLDGREATWRHDGQVLEVETRAPLVEGRTSSLAVTYRCTPRRGFYFMTPDAAHPDRVPHAWSQGQDEDSRHWWPVHDYPNEKATTEMIATVPAGFFALSNGRLVGTRRRGRKVTYHWKLGTPHVPYLVTLAVGRFESIRQRAGKVPLSTYFLPGRREEALRCVKDTPRMLELFAQRLGVAYPYEKYDQVFVEGFIFGGMENTTATTLTDLVLHDARAALDYSCDDLVSHELAHQWWGNLVTCRDWSQAWLNEGFATYFEVVWKEHARGAEEAWMLRSDLREAYFKEDREHYRRPVTCRTYEEPIELFDAHLYQKGALVLHALRKSLGEVLFWRALRTYLEEHRGGNVETHDLRRAVERVSGRNLERFFEQWIESGGYPELKVTSAWDADRGEAVLGVEQAQEGEHTPQVFGLEMTACFLVAGEWHERRVHVTRRQQTFLFRLPGAPDAVVLDPWEDVLCARTWERPVGHLLATLERAPWAPARADAARALARDGSPRAIAGLQRAAAADAFWGVQAAAAEALGTARGAAALEALLACRGVEHPKARRAVVAALGSFRDDRAAAALERILRGGDASYFVEAEAAVSLGKTRQARALPALRRALARRATTWNETVRCGVIDGLGHLGWERRDAAIEVTLPWTARGRFVRCRQAAIRSLARLGAGSVRVRERLEDLLDDPEFRVVLAAAEALGELADRRSAPALSRLADTALDGRVMRTARQSLRRLEDGGDGAVRRLRSDLEELAGEHRKLQDRLDRVDAALQQARRAENPGTAPAEGPLSAAMVGARARRKPTPRRRP
jgi:aminopeptidase N